MTDLPSIPGDAGVVDLGELRRRADERDAFEAEAAAEAAQQAVIQRIVSKDRAMSRAFKGIVPTPERHRWMARAYAKEQV